jgi:hypothetical protein
MCLETGSPLGRSGIFQYGIARHGAASEMVGCCCELLGECERRPIVSGRGVIRMTDHEFSGAR